MHPLDPRIAGLLILAASTVFLGLKRWTTGSLLKGRPGSGFVSWIAHAFNLFFLAGVTPAAATLMAARRWEAFDPTLVSLRLPALQAGFEIGGLLLYLAGNALIGWALVTMRGHFQILGNLPRPTDRLLQSGPYRLVRHPMYASVLAQSLGLALLTQSAAIFMFFLVYAGLIPRLIATEEEGLRRAYGREFAAYQTRVGKLIPRIR